MSVRHRRVMAKSGLAAANAAIPRRRERGHSAPPRTRPFRGDPPSFTDF